MNGGIIDQVKKESDGVFLLVRGLGPCRFQKTIILIPPTNYALREGDLVWWQEHGLRWEGKRAVTFDYHAYEAVDSL